MNQKISNALSFARARAASALFSSKRRFEGVRGRAAGIVGFVSYIMLAGTQAHATGSDPMADIWSAIDLTTVSASVILIMVAVIGITMAFKGGDLGKRAVRKV